MLAPEQVLAPQVPEQVLAPEQALVLQAPGQVLALQGPEQASAQRALAPAWWRPAVRQALALHRFFQKHSKRQ
ncbi:hypothetical protein [Mesorhizobium ventifaucium]|uniref:Uncharacterized protein n=1 Tax=Mesorhizobium ventifaucium TaxID=666020 RepID=A0ABN8KC22_9HYPH|nr:hypothetical protein [Mesorhizobium ventifaucium]CAH2406988.1 conserved hypothetical protein [Mesorhizobium ventifaucium]